MAKILTSLNQVAPSADFIDQLSAFTRALIEQEKWVFGCEVEKFSAEMVAAPDYLFPLVLHRANRWIEQGYGQSAPMDYRQTLDPLPNKERSPLCLAVPEANEPTASVVIWTLFIRHALKEWVDQYPDLVAKKEPIPLDSWYQEWLHDMDNGLVQLLPAKPRQMIEPALGDQVSPLSPGLQSRGAP